MKLDRLQLAHHTIERNPVESWVKEIICANPSPLHMYVARWAELGVIDERTMTSWPPIPGWHYVEKLPPIISGKQVDERVVYDGAAS